MTPYSFTSYVDLPDGRRISVTIDVPVDSYFEPDAETWGELVEHSEVAQMGMVHALGVIRRGAISQARRNEKAPF